jgi:hypothetical protein
MSDTLNQAAKQLKKNKERTNYTVGRYSQNFPLIERLRDSFTSDLPFTMEVICISGQKTRITFNFYEPVPCGDVGVG